MYVYFFYKALAVKPWTCRGTGTESLGGCKVWELSTAEDARLEEDHLPNYHIMHICNLN
jgi:hypothetical protein